MFHVQHSFFLLRKKFCIWNDFLAHIVHRSQRDSDRKQERAIRRELEIQDAALRIFARDGISKSRIGDIAAEAGIPVSNIYEYYDSKEALAYSAPLDHMFKFYNEYVTKVKTKKTSSKKLSFYLWLSADFARRNPLWARVYIWKSGPA